ncbi:FG-GAP repeat domain-containing protein [Algoriphagus zhangzhouensis]|uniref:Repeat domain-containing protein n=1 Tax=Algoriphagus zhangzhouensis TaxID=1073327 RepID=A0A1M7ZAQ5_9BACT|nr:VCBS repeat-containing protein [Algoriphagus zhangzhouensis]TDY47046.1 VCBS repeat protein [Algoriphagus zhangzhouensis]SHO61995.1 Repeat domain-containing protein [Algoriphagus zhangzhouensis]
MKIQRYIFLFSIALVTSVVCEAQLMADRDQSADIPFKKTVLFSDFVSEGVAIGDVNRDGKIDVMAGPYWFEAPNWERHEIYEPKLYVPEKEWSNSMLNFDLDVNQDGWVDLIRVDFPGKAVYWHENPQGKEGHWKVHMIHETVGNESPNFVDIDGDGRKDILCGDVANKQMIWLKAPTFPGDESWKKYTISLPGTPGSENFSHGLGYSDMNGDENPDVIIREGWWENPGNPTQPDWTWHPSNLGEPQSHLNAFDFNQDGATDVFGASAHERGIWWYENKGNGSNQEFIPHLLTEEMSETHAVAFEDMNGDGQKDFVTGKRFYAHMREGTGALEPSYLYWFEFVPGENPIWKAHQIDDDSGVGLNVVAEDINGDGLRDVVIANKKGVFVFEQRKK